MSKEKVRVINGSKVSFVSEKSISPIQSSATCNGGVPGGQRPRSIPPTPEPEVR